jgi:hypothetical protein
MWRTLVAARSGPRLEQERVQNYGEAIGVDFVLLALFAGAFAATVVPPGRGDHHGRPRRCARVVGLGRGTELR